MDMGARRRVIELWCWGMPNTYIARHLNMRPEDVEEIVGTGNGNRR